MTISSSSLLSAYISPISHRRLTVATNGLCDGEVVYRYLPSIPVEVAIPIFIEIDTLPNGGKESLSMYNFEGARDIYRNFLSWLFRTFRVSEEDFRRDLIDRLHLKEGQRVLITGCGIGDDIPSVLNIVGLEKGSVFASDLAPEMVAATFSMLSHEYPEAVSRVSLSVCDACHLPFENGFFDAAFHFGGINLFDDVKPAIDEMVRVTKEGGRIVFGDEGLAPWLTDTEYGHMVVANNHLWKHQAPINLLPQSAINPRLSWVLGNCFYLIEFEKNSLGPAIDPDVVHIGRRGGTMKTRYLGQLEGVSLPLKDKVIKEAEKQNMSVTAWLEQAISNSLKKQ